MKLTVCIGSSCHVKGSQQVVDLFRYMIQENDVGDKVELCGIFCAGQCQRGVCVKVDDDVCSVTPETKSQGLFHQIQKEVTFCGLPHGADA